jgi:hypothetical protein
VARLTGSIRKIIDKKADENNGKPSAFGFIRGDNGRDYFFLPSHLRLHTTGWTDIVAAWKAGRMQRAEFNELDHEKGLRADDVVMA